MEGNEVAGIPEIDLSEHINEREHNPSERILLDIDDFAFDPLVKSCEFGTYFGFVSYFKFCCLIHNRSMTCLKYKGTDFICLCIAGDLGGRPDGVQTKLIAPVCTGREKDPYRGFFPGLYLLVTWIRWRK